jgi:hypothetical protein
MLRQIETEDALTVQACADILYAVHLEGSCYTLYSNIFDPVNLAVYFNYGFNYQQQKKVNLLDELAQWWSFQLVDISYMTGVAGNLLIRTVKMDASFYASSINPFIPIVASVSCIIIVAMGIYFYKRKVREKNMALHD